MSFIISLGTVSLKIRIWTCILGNHNLHFFKASQRIIGMDNVSFYTQRPTLKWIPCLILAEIYI